MPLGLAHCLNNKVNIAHVMVAVAVAALSVLFASQFQNAGGLCMMCVSVLVPNSKC